MKLNVVICIFTDRFLPMLIHEKVLRYTNTTIRNESSHSKRVFDEVVNFITCLLSTVF